MTTEGNLYRQQTPQKNDHFTNSLGQSLFCRYWRLEGKPRALVFICHGFAEHCGRYEQLASDLSNAGLLVFSHDHVGHGHSDGSPVHIDNFMTYVDDVVHHVEIMKEKYPDLPVFIYGHSMGGQVTILAGMKRPDLFRGAVLNAPLVMFDPAMLNPIHIFIGRLISKICPEFPVIKLDEDLITRNKEVVKDIHDDPLCWSGYGKARQCQVMLDAVMATENRLAEFPLPFLVQHGDKDGLTYLPGSQKLYDQSKSSDKTIKIFEGAFHQLLAEPGIGKEVTRQTVDWMVKRS